MDAVASVARPCHPREPVKAEVVTKFDEQVKKQRARRRELWFRTEGEMIFSMAFNSIAKHGSTVTVLLHILSRKPIDPKKKERDRLQRLGQWPPVLIPFSFPVREAKHHGMTEKGLSKGLRELHRVGFIDIHHHGSALRGDFSLYIQSDRWKWYGTESFQEMVWPKSKCVVSRSNENGVFISYKVHKGLKRKHPNVIGHGKDINTAHSAAMGKK